MAAGLTTLNYAPALFADNWFPKISNADDISDGNKSMMTVTGNYVRQGLGLLLFIAAVMSFIKFITTIQHGIEESKKNDGSMVAFGTFAVMGITYLAISIVAGYVGYSMITKFKI
ncbi:TPA: hypothetical protein JBD21_12695 [Legionella pneumophila subsp. pneumophila]|uniref:DUF4134 domain-containing protein n=1 Tax=Legionella pneumophila subsp. pneumophila TaxID=91891 RepID=A0A3A6VX50_LEGPN|nr:hypothetical protein C3929_12320 [Legionella pneumophila]RJY29306.1 hypothetical protein D1H99_02700 [Legionella pneumophila subsp. pneumophila]PYB44429.1 hypothetical protein DM453_13485 [Legionella pneumophila]PYB63416.1 hypothetical protein DMC17_13440 [Legionella pneumophila]RJY31806.1 hypothetical protein D1I00_01845 [Legionella pneumophila subsp. pneumophila]